MLLPSRAEWDFLAQSRSDWIRYAPAGRVDVEGMYTAPDEDGEQKVAAWCAGCGDVYRRTCTTRRAIDHIDRFARVHAHASPGATDTKELDEPLGPTAEERAAVAMVKSAFLHAMKSFSSLAHVDDPEVPADVLTPQRCREMLAITVGPLAVLYGVPVERLDWLARQMLSLTSGGKWTPLHEYLEGEVPKEAT